MSDPSLEAFERAWKELRRGRSVPADTKLVAALELNAPEHGWQRVALTRGPRVGLQTSYTARLKPFVLSVEDYRAHVEASEGLCLECGQWVPGCEPDMEDGECELCGDETSVIGPENALVEGLLAFPEDA